MSETYSLLEFVQRLVSDGPLRADYAADPHGTLAGHGLADLSPQDVRDALVLVDDTRTVDFDPDHVPATATAPAGDDPVHLFDAYVAAHPPVADLDLGPDPDPDVDPGTAVHHSGFAEPADLDPVHFGAGDAGEPVHHDLPADLPAFAGEHHELADAPDYPAEYGASTPYAEDRDDLADLDLHHHDPMHFPHPTDPPG